MAEETIEKDRISFQTEGRLLQELGLRLVAKPEVALVELIKNAYDADAPSCGVRLTNDERTLVIEDTGSGMTIDDFKTKWMRIATASKLAMRTSPVFHRPLTGAKGIGRFAVRYLGDHLILESIAFDEKLGFLTRLHAVFDWRRLDEAKDLATITVPYSLVRVADGAPTTTTLTVTKLRETTSFTKSPELRAEVLRIVTPLQGLERGRFERRTEDEKGDPGFAVSLPGESKTQDVDIAKLVLGNYWGRLTVELSGRKLKFRVWLPGQNKPRALDLTVTTHISNGLFADIRYFPRRKGVFQAKGINGRRAWSWVRENCGVKVVDHGFHIRPYGFPDDDWLQLDQDKAHSARDWRTKIAETKFPIPANVRNDPAANPVLYLPYNFQLVGAVFTETQRNLSDDSIDLVPSMDREGLLENPAYVEFRDYIRAGIEFLAHEDKAELDRREREEAAEAARTAREEIRRAIEFIEDSPTLTSGDKARIVKQYRHLADRVDETEEFSAQARRSLLTMSLLGVVAGFMTHESKAITHELERALAQVRALAKKHPELKETAESLANRLAQFEGYLAYSRMFVKSVRSPKEQPMSAAAQVRHVLQQFAGFAGERGIKVENDVPRAVMTPPLPVTVYSGVLLNLFTNALKAVILVQSSQHKPRVTFRAWNEKGRHIVQVADNGAGVPPDMRRRIFEPLYSTTSDVGNPLGSGMGLGLTLVKQVVAELGGSIAISPEPPPGFTTCFRVSFPFRKPNISK